MARGALDDQRKPPGKTSSAAPERTDEAAEFVSGHALRRPPRTPRP